MFVYICLHLGDVIISWRTNDRGDFVAQSFFLNFRLQYESSEGLMDFLAYLVQNLRQNKQKLISVILTNSPGD